MCYDSFKRTATGPYASGLRNRRNLDYGGEPMAELDQPTIDNPAGAQLLRAFFPAFVDTQGQSVAAFVERMHDRIAMDPDIVFIGSVLED
jgi:hypothetical protein